MEAVRIIKEMRRATHGKYPKFAVWENVPGAFSSNKGEDFRTVLEEIIKISDPEAPPLPPPDKGRWPYADVIVGEGWSVGYRTFDAQHWGRTVLDRDSGHVLQMGTPQRRRRIYLVADFTGESAGEILFKPESLLRHPTESGEEGQDTAADAQGSPGTADRVPYTLKIRSGCEGGGKGALIQEDMSATLATNNDQYLFQPFSTAHSAAESEVAATLYASYGTKWNGNAGAYNGENFVLEKASGVVSKGNGECFTIDEKHCSLTAGGGQAGQGYPCVMQPVAFAQNQRDELRDLGDKAGCLQSEPGMKQQTFIIDNIGGQTEYGKESLVNGTLRAGAQGAVSYAIENHPNDSRVDIDDSGKCQTLTSRMGTGGGNVPMVMEAFCKSGRPQSQEHATTWKHGNVANTLNTFDTGEARANELVVQTIALEGNGQRPSHRGDGYAVTDKSYTLNTTEVHGVAYGISSYDSNAMKSGNPHSGIYVADTSRTLDLNGGSPACNQGGIAIVEERPTYCTTTGSYMQVTKDQTPTLMARDYKDPNVVCYGLDRASFNQGANAQFSFSVLQEHQPTLTAKGPGAVCSRYIVRRLTPTECSRLQGFPDTWGIPPQKDSLTDEEYAFWQKVRNTHATINGRAEKEYTKAQILSWYNKLHTDSSEYKMWGNGIALPNALYVMQGIAEQLQKTREDE